MVPLTTRPAVQAAAPGALDPAQGLAQPGTLLTPAPGKSGEHSGPGQSPGAPWGSSVRCRATARSVYGALRGSCCGAGKGGVAQCY